MTEFTFACSKCNRRVPTSQVRLLPGGKHICFECAGYTPDAPAHASRPAHAAHAEGEEGPAPVAKTRYQCLKCHYEFYIKEGHPKKCPYCNGERIEEKQGGAQKLIDAGGSYRDSDD